MTITFANTGIYTYDKLRVVSQPVKGIEEKTAKLGQETLENVVMETNEITGNITVSKKKALVLSVPYSRGFTAYVDGKETKLQKANTMFMALELEAGTSMQIRLTYCTPYLETWSCPYARRARFCTCSWYLVAAERKVLFAVQ